MRKEPIENIMKLLQAIKYLIKGPLFIMLLSFISACNNSGKDEWVLVWEENFDQQGGFNSEIWSKIPRGSADWNKFMSKNDSCYAIESGHLVLKAIVNTRNDDDTAKVLTGGIWSKEKMLFTEGRIEIRAKFDEGTGIWPAIWMLPEGKKWPRGGEIDIMEHLNFDSIVYQTVHTSYTLAEKEGPQRFGTYPIVRNEYNTYAVELYKDSIRFFTNDSLSLCYPRVNDLGPEQFPFQDEFYLILSNQVGGQWVGNYNIDELPANLYIDWIRYYQKEIITNIAN